MTASMLSGLRWTITQILLQGSPGSSGHGASGGPVEVLLQLTPGKTTLAACILLQYKRVALHCISHHATSIALCVAI